MFGLFDDQKYHSKAFDSEEIRESYKFSAPKWLVYALAGYTGARLYGYLFSCHQASLKPIFDALWGVWLLLLAVPIAMGFVNHYLHKGDDEVVKPWMISMIVVLGVVAIVCYCSSQLMKGVC